MTRPSLLGILLGQLPQPTSPWEDTVDEEPVTTRPVVLVHGTTGSRNNFETIVPLLRQGGQPVLSVSYGNHGTGGLLRSLDEITDRLSAIIDRHGPVDLVGHSQGGLLSLAAAGALTGQDGASGAGDDGDAVIHHVVGLAADFRGVARPWFRPPESRVLSFFDNALSPALAEQVTGSPVLTEVLALTTRTEVPVTQITTRGDWIVTADRARALTDTDLLTGTPPHRGPVRIVTIQDHFPDATIGHAVLPYHREVGELVRKALDDPPRFG